MAMRKDEVGQGPMGISGGAALEEAVRGYFDDLRASALVR